MTTSVARTLMVSMMLIECLYANANNMPPITLPRSDPAMPPLERATPLVEAEKDIESGMEYYKSKFDLDPSDKCSICLERGESDESVVKLKCACSAKFHLKCALRWFTKDNRCACCRKETGRRKPNHTQLELLNNDSVEPIGSEDDDISPSDHVMSAAEMAAAFSVNDSPRANSTEVDVGGSMEAQRGSDDDVDPNAGHDAPVQERRSSPIDNRLEPVQQRVASERTFWARFPGQKLTVLVGVETGCNLLNPCDCRGGSARFICVMHQPSGIPFGPQRPRSRTNPQERRRTWSGVGGNPY